MTTNTRAAVANWFAWSPVAAVLWVAIGAGGFVVASGVRGCDFALPSPAAPVDPMGPYMPDGPVPPAPPPTPSPMGFDPATAVWEWRPFPRSSRLYGSEALCTDVGGTAVMRQIREVAR